MKCLKCVKITLMRFLKVNFSLLCILLGFFLAYGAAGSMDFNAAAGTVDDKSVIVLLIVGMLLIGVGVIWQGRKYSNLR